MAISGGNPVELKISDGENTQAYPAISNATIYNLFQYTIKEDDQFSLIPTPGFELLHTISPASSWRGIFSSNLLNGVMVGVGDEVHLVAPTTIKLLFNIETFKGKIYFEENSILTQPTDQNPGGQIAISDGSNIYVYQIDGTLTKAKNDGGTVLGFQPGMLSFQDGTFFCNDVNSNRIYQSKIIDARIWPADKFGIIDNETRGCLGLKTVLYVFGRDITQLFHDAATPQGFTYTKDTIRSFEYGAVNPESIGRGLDFFVWLGQTQYSQPTILISNGGDPQIISTPGIDAILNRLKNPENNNAFVYEEWGHTFYQINFFEDDLSLLYNFTTNKWQRVSNEKLGMHPVQGVATYRGRNQAFCISSEKGNVYNFGLNLFTNDGKIIPRSVITENKVWNERPHKCMRLDIEMEQGENEETTQVCVLVSKDRGRVFRPYKRKRFFRKGFRHRVLRFFQFGCSKWWTFKIDVYSKDRVIIMKLTGYFE